jgi:hypothetical protein
MPISNAVFTLSNTTRTKIVEADNMGQEVHLHNMNKTNNHYVHIGTSSMTLANSIHLDPSESIVLRLNPTDELYAMSDPNNVVVGVLCIRQSD